MFCRMSREDAQVRNNRAVVITVVITNRGVVIWMIVLSYENYNGSLYLSLTPKFKT